MTMHRPRAPRSIAIRVLGMAGVLSLASLPLLPGVASAHPLGNFSVNTAATVVVGVDEVSVDYAVDLAEVPTLQSNADADDDGRFDDDELSAFAAARCDQVANDLQITLDGVATRSTVQRAVARAAVGSADLATLRVDCRFDVERAGGATGPIERIEIDDRHASDHIGWHEVVIAGDEMTVMSTDVLTTSPSDHLTAYPEGDPLDITSAVSDLTVGGPPHIATIESPRVDSFVPGVDSIANRLIGGQGGELTGWSAIALLGTAAVLGALHAFAPGHGKTVMAAYLLGEQGGSVRQALVLGTTVTATHTVGVLALGALISLTTLSSPDSIYPWLGILSGLLVAGIGANLLRMAVRNRATGGLIHLGHDHGIGGHSHGPHDHDHGHHGHDHDHPHHDHPHHDHPHHDHPHHDHPHHDHPHHDHDHDDHDHGHHERQDHGPDDVAGRMKLGSVIAMGFAGGMVPSPSALIVLLGAVALGRTVFGIGLVGAYGVGMACTLVGAGLAFVILRDRSARLLTSDPGNRLRSALRYGPLVTAVAVVVGGALIAARAAVLL